MITRDSVRNTIPHSLRTEQYGHSLFCLQYYLSLILELIIDFGVNYLLLGKASDSMSISVVTAKTLGKVIFMHLKQKDVSLLSGYHSVHRACVYEGRESLLSMHPQMFR